MRAGIGAGGVTSCDAVGVGGGGGVVLVKGILGFVDDSRHVD